MCSCFTYLELSIVVALPGGAQTLHSVLYRSHDDAENNLEASKGGKADEALNFDDYLEAIHFYHRKPIPEGSTRYR